MELESLLRALADRTRLRLMNLIRAREVCVCYLVEVLKLPQPKVSRHLAYLRRAGIVASRRQGYWMHYRIVKPKSSALARVFQLILATIPEDPQMQHDSRVLQRVAGKPEKFARLQGAPPPTELHGVVIQG